MLMGCVIMDEALYGVEFIFGRNYIDVPPITPNIIASCIAIEKEVHGDGIGKNKGCSVIRDTDMGICRMADSVCDDASREIHGDHNEIVMDEGRNSMFGNESNSYASMVKNDDIPKNLEYIPTVITDSGNEVVIFDELLVQKGSERWCLTIYGQFVRYDMHITVWRDNEGLNVVPTKGPWMVENKPLFLQTWNSKIGMQKLEPKKMLF
nr:hypothetical protein [Tanacetum cinerariifolium]